MGGAWIQKDAGCRWLQALEWIDSIKATICGVLVDQIRTGSPRLTPAASIRNAFNAKFYHADTGLYGNGSQTSLSCALYQGLVPPENHARVLANLIAAVEKTGGGTPDGC